MKQFGTFEQNKTYKEREGSYGVALQGDKVLIEMARLGYFLPGGGIEAGETPEQALQREVLEESGYTITTWQKIETVVEYIGQGGPFKKIRHFYLIELGTKGEPTYDDGHVFPVEWIPIEDVRNNMFSESQWWAIEEGLKLHHSN